MTTASSSSRDPHDLGSPAERGLSATAGEPVHSWGARLRFNVRSRLLLVWVAALTLTMAAGLLAMDHREQQLLASQADHEGYAWNVAQYQLALERVRGGLQALANGDRIDDRSRPLATQVAVLASRTHVIVDESEYATFFRRLAQFPEMARSMQHFNAQLQSEVAVSPDSGPDSSGGALTDAGQSGMGAVGALPARRRAAVALLQSLDSVSDLAIDFANDVRAAEVQAAESRQRGFERYRQWLLGMISVAMGGLLFWVGQLDRARKTLRRTAAERQAALEAEQSMRAQLQEAQQAKNQFMGMVSHELRSPLQSILSALDLLDIRHRSRISNSDPSDGREPERELIARIRRASTGLEGQLRDLLTLAQGEAGVLELRPEPFEAVALVEDVVEQWQAKAKAKGLHLRVAAGDEPIFVVADPLRVTQVISNLVSNAVKYTDHGHVVAHVALNTMPSSPSCLVLEVCDTGPGIPVELQSRVFGAWRRFGALEGRAQSAGIGLAILHTVVQQLGGTVELQSVPGSGSRFTVRVPVVVPVAPEGVNTGMEASVEVAPCDGVGVATRPAAASPTSVIKPVSVGASSAAHASKDVTGDVASLPLPGLRLLIVDDRADVLEALRSVAAELGVICDVADGVAVAANLLAVRRYETVLIDLNMPVKSGQELASEVRRGQGPNANARLLAMSAGDLQGVGHAWPFDGFLSKPVDLLRLSTAIGCGGQCVGERCVNDRCVGDWVIASSEVPAEVA